MVIFFDVVDIAYKPKSVAFFSVAGFAYKTVDYKWRLEKVTASKLTRDKKKKRVKMLKRDKQRVKMAKKRKKRTFEWVKNVCEGRRHIERIYRIFCTVCFDFGRVGGAQVWTHSPVRYSDPMQWYTMNGKDLFTIWPWHFDFKFESKRQTTHTHARVSKQVYLEQFFVFAAFFWRLMPNNAKAILKTYTTEFPIELRRSIMIYVSSWKSVKQCQKSILIT